MISRSGCLICNQALTPIHVFKNFPVYMGIQKDSLSLKEDMVWSACEGCGCIQLNHLIEPDILYQAQHNPAIGKTWELHNKAFSQYIIDNQAKHIVDIGGANLKIADIVALAPSVESYTVVDTSADQYGTSSNSKIKTIKGFIEKITLPKKVDTIVLSHTFEHFYNPVEILDALT